MSQVQKQQKQPIPCEVITLTNASFMSVKDPNNPNMVILLFTVQNGRQYQIPLDRQGQSLVHRATSPLEIPANGGAPRKMPGSRTG